MNALQTTTISVYRGTTTNEYNDIVDDNTTPLATGIPASLIEQRRNVTTNVDSPRMDTRVVRYLTGRVSSGVDIRNNDRIKDDNTDLFYFVEGKRQPQCPVTTLDIVFECKLTN